MAIGDEVYKVRFDISGSAPSEVLSASRKTEAEKVSDALNAGHSLTLRLGQPGKLASPPPALAKVVGLLKDLPDIKHSLALVVPATIEKDARDVVVVRITVKDNDPLAPLLVGGDATLLVNLSHDKSAGWPGVADLLGGLAVGFEAEMTCVGDGP